MAKATLGIDIGHDSLKLALCKGGAVKKTVAVPMPKNLVREGRVTSRESMTELIRTTMRNNGIHASRAALALTNDVSYVRTVTMPIMTAEQLELNIPYEFNDYITDELKNYAFDYAMISTPDDLVKAREEYQQRLANEEDDVPAPTMELMVAAVPVSVLEEAREMLRKAGLKLVRAAPSLCGFTALIRRMEQRDGGGEYCILDLGFRAIRMYMFQGDRHMVTRVLETGLSVLDEVIADAANVDVHLAHTYLLTNYDGCWNKDYCVNAYNNIAVELTRAMNFYRFSNPDSELTDVWICGGGAVITPLQVAIAETMDVAVHQAAEMVPGGENAQDCYSFLEAIGIALEE